MRIKFYSSEPNCLREEITRWVEFAIIDAQKKSTFKFVSWRFPLTGTSSFYSWSWTCCLASWSVPTPPPSTWPQLRCNVSLFRFSDAINVLREQQMMIGFVVYALTLSVNNLVDLSFATVQNYWCWEFGNSICPCLKNTKSWGTRGWLCLDQILTHLDQIFMLKILFAHVSRQDHDEEGVGCV